MVHVLQGLSLPRMAKKDEVSGQGTSYTGMRPAFSVHSFHITSVPEITGHKYVGEAIMKKEKKLKEEM